MRHKEIRELFEKLVVDVPSDKVGNAISVLGAKKPK